MYLTTLGKRAISFTPEGYLNFLPNEFKKKKLNIIYSVWYKNRYTYIYRMEVYIKMYRKMREIFFIQLYIEKLFDLVF